MSRHYRIRRRKKKDGKPDSIVADAYGFHFDSLCTLVMMDVYNALVSRIRRRVNWLAMTEQILESREQNWRSVAADMTADTSETEVDPAEESCA